MDKKSAPPVLPSLPPSPASKFPKEQILADLDWLYRNFPNTFIRQGYVYPLKKGIFKDILALKRADQPPRKRLQTTLAFYTHGFRYLNALIRPKAKRIDLEGRWGEEILASERNYADVLLKQLYPHRFSQSKHPSQPIKQNSILQDSIIEKCMK